MMADIRFETDAVYGRFRKVLLASRRDVLAKLAFVPSDLQARRRWLYRGLGQIDEMLATKTRVEGRRIITVKPGIATALGDSMPVGKLYRGGLQDAQDRLKIAFPILDVNVARYAAHYEFGWLKNLEDDVRFKVGQSIRTGVMLGEGTAATARRLTGTGLARGVWPSIEARARIIARSETADIVVNGRLDGYRELEVDKVIFAGRATECKICGPLVGKIYKIDEVPDRALPHPNCVHDWVAYSRKGTILWQG